jgi:hypothetical protein
VPPRYSEDRSGAVLVVPLRNDVEDQVLDAAETIRDAAAAAERPGMELAVPAGPGSRRTSRASSAASTASC